MLTRKRAFGVGLCLIFVLFLGSSIFGAPQVPGHTWLDHRLGAGTSSRVQGQIDEWIGSGQQSLGRATHNRRMQAQGAMRRAQGKAEQMIGKAEGSWQAVGLPKPGRS